VDGDFGHRSAHETRLKLVANAMREPEFAGRKWARLAASEVPATMGIGGLYPRTSATDADLVTYISSRWTSLATAMGSF